MYGIIIIYLNSHFQTYRLIYCTVRLRREKFNTKTDFWALLTTQRVEPCAAEPRALGERVQIPLVRGCGASTRFPRLTKKMNIPFGPQDAIANPSHANSSDVVPSSHTQSPPWDGTVPSWARAEFPHQMVVINRQSESR